ncbi:MAG: hypothetical protein O3B86_19355 [Planctomycetota bacterium]|nr:hypothetical protein [Planctomycetota bacterium]
MARRRKSNAKFSLFAFQDIITSVTGIMILVTLMLALELLQRTENSPPTRTRELIEQIQATLQEVQEQIERLETQQTAADPSLQNLAVLDAETLRRKLEQISSRRQSLTKDINELIEDVQETSQRERELNEEQRRRQPELAELEQIQKELEETRERLEELENSNRVVFNRPDDAGNRTPWLVEFTGTEILVAELGVSHAPQRFASEAEFLQWVRQQNPSSNFLVLLVKPDSVEQYDGVVDELLERQFPYGVNLLNSEQTAIDSRTGASGL